MDKHIAQALHASLYEYGQARAQDTQDIKKRLEEVFPAHEDFLSKVNRLDEVFDDYPDFEELREYYFDLLLMNFFAVDVSRLEGDYLESAEWEKIEEQTIDRGSELLNLLLYLRECADESIVPSLSDYLKEFLLVEEDEFQDEYRIYEAVIENQQLVESSYAEIARVSAKVSEQSELSELFYPMIAFFNEPEPTQGQFRAYTESSENPALDTALLALIIAFNQSK